MKKGLLLVVLLLFCSTAQASETSHRAAAEQLLEASKAERNLEKLYSQMEASIEEQFKALQAPEDALPILMKYQKKQLEIVQSELSWPVFKHELATAYMKVYSEEEMQEITKFYQSPAGVKFVDKMPELTQQMMNLVQGHVPALVERAQKVGEELVKELEAYDKRKEAQQKESEASSAKK